MSETLTKLHPPLQASPMPSDEYLSRLAPLVTVLPDAILCLDSNWRFTFANAEAQRLSRFNLNDLNGKTHWELYPETLGTPIETLYREVMESRLPGYTEYHHQPFGLWLDIHVLPIEDGIALHYRDITDRKAIEAHRDSSARQLQQVMEVTTDAVFILSSDWTFSFLNKHAMSILGRDDLTGKNVWQEFPAAVEAEFYTRYHQTMAHRTPCEFESYYPAPLNKWFAVQCRPSDEGIVVFFRDITEERADRQILLDQRATLSFVQQTARVATWEIDLITGLMTFGSGSYPVYRRPASQIRSMAELHEVVHSDDLDKLKASRQRAIANNSVATIEYRVVAPDGTIFWVEGLGVPAYDQFGVAIRIRGMTTDITVRKRNEEELRASETRYRILADALHQKQEETERQRAELETVYRTAPIGLALFDPNEFRFLRLNDRQAEIVGLPPEQVIGRTLTEIAPIEGLREMFEQVIAGNPIQDSLLEGELITRPGEHRYWNVNYFPVYAPDGSVQAISAASLEITHQKKSELALIQSEKLAAVGRLASSISHEINNPLEAITNLLFLINMNDNLPEPVKLYVNMAQSELTRVSQIVTQTLRFHRQTARPTSVTAAELVNAVLNLYQGRLINSGIHVEAKYASKSQIICFENDIRQVLNNLIANAIDAMRGGGRLIVRAHDTMNYRHHPSDEGPPREGVRITIADTGHGMPPNVRARIFEPFYTTKDLNGTGLGLWISSGIIARHQGVLTVRSSQDPRRHGTAFSLFLPFREQ